MILMMMMFELIALEMFLDRHDLCIENEVIRILRIKN